MTKKNSFLEGWSWFKFNNVGLALGMALKFYAIVTQFYTIPTSVEFTEEKLVGGLFSRPLPPFWIGWRYQNIYPDFFDHVGKRLDNVPNGQYLMKQRQSGNEIWLVKRVSCGEACPRPFSEKTKLSVSLDQLSEMLCSLFLLYV